MSVPKKKEFVEAKEDWLATYADAITLLMAFFVMMLTFAEFDIPAFEEAAAAIKDKIGSGDKTSPTEQLKIDVEDVVFQAEADRIVQVSKDAKGIVIELASNNFYKPGSAELKEAAFPFLEKIGKTITAPRFSAYNIQIEGHTDDVPIKTEKFPSNWELSTARAATVVRFFAERGIVEPLKLSAAGFADQKPKVPNRTETGESIPENQATNRRTSIRVNAMSLKEKDAWFIYLEKKRAAEEEAKRAQAATEDANQQPAGNPEESQAGPGEGVPAVDQPAVDQPAADQPAAAQ